MTFASSEQLQESNFEHTEVFNTSRVDLDFLAALATPDVFKYFFPGVYKSIWSLLCTTIVKVRDFSQIAIGLPRGFAKTYLIKLFVLWVILFTRKQFILIISENEPKAVSIVSDICDMLDEPNIIAVFGNWRLNLEVDNQIKKKFSFRGRDIIIKAAGAGTGIRGITEKNRRPDLMIFDDIQSREDSESEIIANQLEKWLVATALKAKSPEGCLFVFIANMYPTKGSLLRKLKQNPNWIKFIAGGVLANGESLWEDLQPIEQLKKEFQNDLAAGHPEIFFAEVLNDENATVNNLLDLSSIPDYKYRDDDIPEGKFIVIDPAGNKVNSDAVSIGYFEVFDGYPQLIKILEGRLSPGDIIREAIKMALENKVSIIGIESNGFQQSLNYWFDFITAQLGITGIEPREVYSGTHAKTSRILQSFKQILAGEIGIHPTVRPQVFLQVTQFNPLRKDNIDGLLDLIVYAPKMLELYGVEIYNSTIIEMQQFAAIPIVYDNSPF